MDHHSNGIVFCSSAQALLTPHLPRHSAFAKALLVAAVMYASVLLFISHSHAFIMCSRPYPHLPRLCSVGDICWKGVCVLSCRVSFFHCIFHHVHIRICQGFALWVRFIRERVFVLLLVVSYSFSAYFIMSISAFAKALLCG